MVGAQRTKLRTPSPMGIGELATIITLLALPVNSFAQASGSSDTSQISNPSPDVVQIDAANHEFYRSLTLPFHNAFLLSVPILTGTREIRLSLTPRPGTTGPKIHLMLWEADSRRTDAKNAVFYIPPLSQGVYDISLEHWFNSLGLTECTDETDQMCRVRRYVGRTQTTLTSKLDVETGVITTGSAYTGLIVTLNYHLFPRNRVVPHPNRPNSWQLQRRAEFSVFVGAAVTEFHSSRAIQNQFVGGNPVVGVGLGLGVLGLDAVRLVAGAMFFKEVDANPLIDQKRNKIDGFVGLSMNIAVKDILGAVSALIGLK